ncbi:MULTISPECIES: hypothetical protein [Trichocoleus]|nr:MULTISPECIES: hypothetical protein [unclassified Trichocoleus]
MFLSTSSFSVAYKGAACFVSRLESGVLSEQKVGKSEKPDEPL